MPTVTQTLQLQSDMTTDVTNWALDDDNRLIDPLKFSELLGSYIIDPIKTLKEFVLPTWSAHEVSFWRYEPLYYSRIAVDGLEVERIKVERPMLFGTYGSNIPHNIAETVIMNYCRTDEVNTTTVVSFTTLAAPRTYTSYASVRYDASNYFGVGLSFTSVEQAKMIALSDMVTKRLVERPLPSKIGWRI